MEQNIFLFKNRDFNGLYLDLTTVILGNKFEMKIQA